MCADICRFNAIPVINNQHTIKKLNCEGCGYCEKVCPEEAITLNEQNVGDWFQSSIRTGATMVHARLKIGADNSGKLVAKVKNEAKAVAKQEGKDLVLVDGSPGEGCPVVSSLSGASFTVLVTESSVSGLHDLTRVHQLVKMFGIPAGCIINKADLNPRVLADLKSFLEDEGISLLGEIPYNEKFTEAVTNGKTIVEWDAGLEKTVNGCWREIEKLVIAD